MMLLNLILILLIGGSIAWWSERLGNNIPRLVAVIVLIVDFLYLLANLIQVPIENFYLTPVAADPNTWLFAYKAAWIPRFGINFELAMDGLSLTLILLTLVLGVIAVISSW